MIYLKSFGGWYYLFKGEKFEVYFFSVLGSFMWEGN